MNAGSDGSGQIEFRRWETPVETRRFGILDVTQSVDNSVIVRVEAAEGGVTTFAFSDVLGLRVQDEGGLTQLWAARSEAVQGCATFMVRISAQPSAARTQALSPCGRRRISPPKSTSSW